MTKNIIRFGGEIILNKVLCLLICLAIIFNPVFANPVYIHSPDVIVERVRGSGLLPHLHSDAPVTYHDVDDVHEEKTVRQKSLSAGAALLLKLAATLITGNPFTGAGVGSVMLSAGYATLCGEASVCLVEQDGNPGRAIDELGRRHIVQTVGMSMATAGLTKAAGGLAGVTNSTAIGNLAKRELIRSAVRTTLAVSLEGKEFGDAFKQGITSAAINTVAAWGASRIGDLYKPDEAVDTRDAPSSSAAAEPISSAAHKALHFGLGSALGATTAAITGQDITRSAVSGGVGAVLGESFAEAFDSKALGDFLATATAFATGLEADIAYLASTNATEYNYKMHPGDRLYLQQLGMVAEGEEVYEGDEIEKTDAQKHYEKGRQRYIKSRLDEARQSRRTAITREDYDFIVENADKAYARAYWAGQGPGLTVEYGLTTAAFFAGGTTGIVFGAADTAYGIATGKTKAPETAQDWMLHTIGALPGMKLASIARGASKLDKLATHASSSSAASKMPACMTQSQNPKAAMFKRVAQDDWSVDVAKLRQETLGKAVRQDAIPSSSKLEYLAPGRVKFDGVEFRAVRDLGHLSDVELKGMLKGRNPVDTAGIRLDGHHHMQKYHREPGAFMVEIPDPLHCISKPAQHPLGVKGGLSATERADWKALRPKFNMERARTELLRRGIHE